MSEIKPKASAQNGSPVRSTGLFGAWTSRPHDRLRKYDNGTMFLLRLHTGAIHVCQLYGNLPDDESWKAKRLTDHKVIRLENLQCAEFMLLSPNDKLTHGDPR